MNKRNLIITSVSVFLTTTLIALGIFFGLKKPDEVKKEDDDQTLKKEIETLENEFKTLKSNFDEKFNKLQNEDFEEYPQDDQEQIKQIKEELQKFKKEIAQKQCDQSELTGKKACLLKINSQITNQNEKFDIIVIVGQINIDATKLKNFQNFNPNDTSFVDSKLIAEIKNVDKFYQDFHVKKQECFNETKLQARKICFEHLKKKLNSNFVLVINVNNTYYEQKNKISTSISDLFTQIDKDFYRNKPPEFDDLSFVNQTFHDHMNTIKNFYANFLNNGKKCNDKLLKDKKECLEKLKKELDDTLALISKINKDYDDQEKNITDFINSFEIKNNILINLDLSFVNDLQLIRNINDIKNLYQESNQNCSKLIELNDRKKCLEGPTFELISNSSDEIIKKYNEQKEAIKKGIQTIINELEKKIKELKIKKEILQFDDLSFMHQTEFNDHKTKINNFYDNFVYQNQTCFNKEKLQDQKDCYVNLTNKLNDTLILVNNTNKTYFDQKKNISDQIEKFKNELNSLKELIVNNYDVLIQQVLIKPINLEIKKIKTEVNCNHEKLLGLKFSCYQEQINKSKNITSPLNYDFDILQNKIKNINSNVNLISSKLYDLIFSDIISLFTKEEKVKEQLTKEITDFLEYYQLLKSINNIDIDKLTNNNATTLSALINKIVDFIGVKKQYNESDILQRLKNELNSLEELTVNNYDVITQQIFIKSINQEIKDIKKVNCDNKKTLKLKLFCYQEQINKIKEITSISYHFGGNYYCHIHNVNNNKDLISSKLYNLIFNDNIILSTKKEKIKEQLTKEINDYFINNQYYRIFKTLNYQNVIYSFFSRRYSIDILIKKLNNNETNNFLALITKISDFIHLKVEIEKFVKSRLQSKFLGTYNNVNNTLDFVLFVAKPLILLSNVVVNIAMLFSSGKTNKITRLTISFGYYYLVYNSSPSTISEGSDALKTDSFLVEKYNKYVYNPLNNYFFEVKSSYIAIYSELFGSINLTQELKIKITDLENMSDDELNDIIQQIQQKENSLVASFNGFAFHTRKIKQIIIVFSHMAIYYGISLSSTKLIELIGKLCKNPTLNHGGDQNFGHQGYYHHGNDKQVPFIPFINEKKVTIKEIKNAFKELIKDLQSEQFLNIIEQQNIYLEKIKNLKRQIKSLSKVEDEKEKTDLLNEIDKFKQELLKRIKEENEQRNVIKKIEERFENLKFKKIINKEKTINKFSKKVNALKLQIEKLVKIENEKIEQKKAYLLKEIAKLAVEQFKEFLDHLKYPVELEKRIVYLKRIKNLKRRIESLGEIEDKKIKKEKDNLIKRINDLKDEFKEEEKKIKKEKIIKTGIKKIKRRFQQLKKDIVIITKKQTITNFLKKIRELKTLFELEIKTENQEFEKEKTDLLNEINEFEKKLLERQQEINNRVNSIKNFKKDCGVKISDDFFIKNNIKNINDQKIIKTILENRINKKNPQNKEKKDEKNDKENKNMKQKFDETAKQRLDELEKLNKKKITNIEKIRDIMKELDMFLDMFITFKNNQFLNKINLLKKRFAKTQDKIIEKEFNKLKNENFEAITDHKKILSLSKKINTLNTLMLQSFRNEKNENIKKQKEVLLGKISKAKNTIEKRKERIEYRLNNEKTINFIHKKITDLNYHFNYEFEYDSIKTIKERINNHLYYDDYELKVLNDKIKQLEQELLTRKKFEEEKEKKRLKKKQTEEYCTATFILVVTILILIKKLK